MTCGASLEGRHKARKYCDDRCKVAHRRVEHHDPPAFVGSYELLPEHIRRCFTPGDPDDCWIYSKRAVNGYATNTSVNMYKAGAYKLIYLMMVGPVPEGMDIDHTCDNGRGGCVNWNHLKVVTHRENMIRPAHTIPGNHVRKTHCPKGHPYTAENTRLETYRGTLERHCRICKAEHHRAHKERDPEAFNRKRREHYARNRERILAQKQAWRDRKREAS